MGWLSFSGIDYTLSPSVSLCESSWSTTECSSANGGWPSSKPSSSRPRALCSTIILIPKAKSLNPGPRWCPNLRWMEIYLFRYDIVFTCSTTERFFFLHEILQVNMCHFANVTICVFYIQLSKILTLYSGIYSGRQLEILYLKAVFNCFMYTLFSMCRHVWFTPQRRLGSDISWTTSWNVNIPSCWWGMLGQGNLS